MNSVMTLALVGFFAVIALAVVAAIIGSRRERERQDSMATLAATREWTYAARADSWVDRFEGAPFGVGRDRTAKNILTGKYEGRMFVAFDYHYATTSTTTDAQGHTTTRTDHHHFSVTALDLDVDFPALEVTPEGFFSRLAGRISGRDIELESEQFNRTFTVHCPDRKFASDVLHPQMMEFLLSYPTLAWRCQGGGLVAIRQGQHSVAELEAKLKVLNEIANRIPAFLWQAFDPSGAA